MTEADRKCAKMIAFLLLSKEQQQTRNVLVKLTKWPRTTVYEVLLRLENAGHVKRVSVKSGRGRPQVYWKLAN